MTSKKNYIFDEKFKNGAVAIFGLGGLGSNISVMLARAGIGKLILIDFDKVEESNLNRQAYFLGDIGKAKTCALAEIIKAINPSVQLETHLIRATADNVISLCGEAKIVCEAFDDPQCKAMIVEQVLYNSTDKVVVCGSGMAGNHSANEIVTVRKMERLYMSGDGVNSAKDGEPLLSSRVMLCAAHQANMILRLLSGEVCP